MADDADLKRRYREFVLSNHPDRGGDREVFERGVAAYRAALLRVASGRARAGTDSGSPVVTHRTPGVGRALRRRWRRRRRGRG